MTESAYDTARQYAKDRIQGPLFTNRDAGPVPIIQEIITFTGDLREREDEDFGSDFKLLFKAAQATVPYEK